MEENQQHPGKDLQGRLERLEHAVASMNEQLEAGQDAFRDAAHGEGVAPAMLSRQDVAVQIQDALAPVLERLKGIEADQSRSGAEGERRDGPFGAFVF